MTDTAEFIPPPPVGEPAESPPWSVLPPGDYAIVEIMGKSTLIGRIEEVDRFGIKMLAIQPMFAGQLLPAVFQGGASIYRLTPCTAEVAWNKSPRADQAYALPATIRATLAPLQIEGRATDADTTDDEDLPF